MTDYKKLCKVCAHVFFYDEFTVESAKKLKVEIDDARDRIVKDKLKGLILHINSEGGDPNACYYLFNILASLPVSVHTVIDGVAFSAGAILFMVGKERFMFENSILMFHGLHTTVKRTLRKTSAEELLDRVKIFETQEIQIIRSKSVISNKQLERLFESDKFLGHEEALHYNFANNIIHCKKGDAVKVSSLSRSIGKSDISNPIDNLQTTILSILSGSAKSEPIRLLLGFDGPAIYTSILPLCNYLSLYNNTICTAVAPCDELETCVMMSGAYRLAFSLCHFKLRLASDIGSSNEQMKDRGRNNKMIQDVFKRIIKTRANIPFLAFRKIDNTTISLDPQKALEWNIIDGIIPST